MIKKGAISTMREKKLTYNPRDWSIHPPYLSPDYKSTVLRSPKHELSPIVTSLSELTGPVYGHNNLAENDGDLTKNAIKNGEPIGERIIVYGRVIDENERPVRKTLIEVWQANSAGRYLHKNDQHDAPLDPNFSGGGRCVTDENGTYKFVTILPGAYPWPNHHNAWRPRHIHFSLFGPSFSTRLVTQMYFPGDPLLEYDPIYHSISDPKARASLVSKFSLDVTEPNIALGYQFDIVLRGNKATPMEAS